MKFIAAGTVATLVALAGSPASAGLNCGTAYVDVGDSGRSGVVSTYVAHDPNGTWTIKHTLSNGAVIDRSLQYVITDYTNRNVLQWRGTLMRNPALTMVGEPMTLAATGQPTYNEWLYKNGQLIMHSMALCQFETPPASVVQPSAPPVAAPAPAPAPVAMPVTTASVDDSVKIVNVDAAAYVPLEVGSQAVTMLLDTGATVMSLNESVADSLVAKGEAERTVDTTMTMADGHHATVHQIIVHDIKIGAHTLHNVRATITPENAEMLLPFPVLNQLGRFTIDSANNKLIFG
jgi:clan AA aspartic protease (TIGR02281 family)